MGLEWRWVWIVITLNIVALSGCQFARRVRISAIDQGQSRNQSIAIEGKVTSRVSLVGVGVFIVNDGTGSIGVVTVNDPPRVGRFLRVYGTVENVASIGAEGLGDAELNVLIEEGTNRSIVNAMVMSVMKSAASATVHHQVKKCQSISIYMLTQWSAKTS